MFKVIRISAKIIAILFILFVASLIIATSMPARYGYKLLVVTSGSMTPAIKAGSLIVSRETQNIQKGDIITYRMHSDSQALVTHRVINVQTLNNADVYQVKGDAVEKPDIELVKKSQIVGIPYLILPYLGIPLMYAKTKVGVVIFIVIPASIIVYEELRSMATELKKKKYFLGLRKFAFK